MTFDPIYCNARSDDHEQRFCICRLPRNHGAGLRHECLCGRTWKKGITDDGSEQA